jgi:hypothetical protein
MHHLGNTLREHARRFRELRGSGLPKATRDAADQVLEHLIEWSVANASELSDRGPEGVDPAFGVAPSAGIATVWRVYPRQADGGKVTLLSRAEHLLRRDERAEIIAVLEQLQTPKTIGAGQRLDIGLARLAADTRWDRFSALLPKALEVAKRHRNAPAV